MTKAEMQERWDNLQEMMVHSINENSELIAIREHQVDPKTDVEKALNEAFTSYMQNENVMLYAWLDRKHRGMLKYEGKPFLYTTLEK